MINIPRLNFFETQNLEKNTFLFRQILQHDKIKNINSFETY
jgi:hypothetical protein